MKIFYDNEGNVVGHIEAAPGYEDSIEIEGAEGIAVPKEIAEQINDPDNPLTPNKVDISSIEQPNN